MRPIKNRAYAALLLMAVLLCVSGVLAYVYQEQLTPFFFPPGAERVALVLNGIIVLLFGFGLLRMASLFASYAHEQDVLERFVARIKENAANPLHKLDSSTLIVRRVNAVQTLADQEAEINQSALAAVAAAGEGSRFTLVRFVHSTLIMSGVFGTVVSLAIALVGAADLLNSPDNLQKMGTIIAGMSTALNTTVMAIVCYAIYSYLHLRLQDTRIQFLANLEEVTTLHIMPHFRTTEGAVIQDMNVLVRELRYAAESVGKVQDRFLQAGDRLQLAVDDLQSQIIRIGNTLARGLEGGSEDLRMIRESVREGFRLEEKPAKPSSPSAPPANFTTSRRELRP